MSKPSFAEYLPFDEAVEVSNMLDSHHIKYRWEMIDTYNGEQIRIDFMLECGIALYLEYIYDSVDHEKIANYAKHNNMLLIFVHSSEVLPYLGNFIARCIPDADRGRIRPLSTNVNSTYYDVTLQPPRKRIHVVEVPTTMQKKPKNDDEMFAIKLDDLIMKAKHITPNRYCHWRNNNRHVPVDAKIVKDILSSLKIAYMCGMNIQGAERLVAHFYVPKLNVFINYDNPAYFNNLTKDPRRDKFPKFKKAGIVVLRIHYRQSDPKIIIKRFLEAAAEKQLSGVYVSDGFERSEEYTHVNDIDKK